MELSFTTKSFRESVIREMTRICDKVGGINLAQGFPDFPASEEVKNAAINAIRTDNNQYTVTYGSPELRAAIANKVLKYNHIQAEPETEITVTCGATEAMIATMKAIINPGDEVIVFEPFYENYGPDAILSGATPRFITLHPPYWTFSLDELRKSFNDKTKAVILNTPNNPTGKVFSREELEEIAKLCIKWDCIAVCDEIYEHILYDGKKHLSIASFDGMQSRTVTINSISKTYSLTGWRVGWAIAAESITKSIRTVHDFLTVGAPAPLQEAAAFAIANSDQYYSELCAKYNRAREHMYQLLLKTGFTPYLPAGAYYIIADTSTFMERLGLSDDFQFSLWLLNQAGIATVPGTSFYSDKAKKVNQVRFCFCKRTETLEQTTNRLSKIALPKL